MEVERRFFLLHDGESVEVVRDLQNRRVTFVFRGLISFDMHIRQGYHLAKFLAGVKDAIADDEEEGSSTGEMDDTKPVRVSVHDLDLSDADPDPD